MFDLIVTSPFEGYAIGQRITDAEQIDELLAGPQRVHVVKVAAEPRENSEPPSEHAQNGMPSFGQLSSDPQNHDDEPHE